MIRAEVFNDLPAFPLEELTEHSLNELRAVGDLSGLLGAKTTFVYDGDKFLLSVSVRQNKNFLAPAEIFLLVGKAYDVKYARQSKKFIDDAAKRYIGLRTLIDVRFPAGCRFAEFLGFKERGKPFDYAGRCFQLYEVY